MFIKKATVSFLLILTLMFTLVSGLAPAAAAGPLAGKVIFLDPGHGLGSDNRVGTYSEQATMLALSQRIGALLTAQGATVHYTRSTETNVLLDVRVAMINKQTLLDIRSSRPTSEHTEIDRLIGLMQEVIDNRNPLTSAGRILNSPFDEKLPIHSDLEKIFRYQSDPMFRDNYLMISLHTNAASSTGVRGAEVYYISPTEHANTRTYFPDFSFSAQSRRFADILLNNIHNTGIPRRTWGLRAQNYFMIREINIPAVLTENGFHTNITDRNMLQNPAYLDSLARAYLFSIAAYFNVTIPGLTPPAPPPAVPQPLPPFRDVPANHVAYEAIHWAQNNGFITGNNGIFYPDDTLTRYAFVLIMHRYAGLPTPKNNHQVFTDVSPSSIAFTAINWAHENGLVTGHSGRFFPNDPVSREAVVLVLHRFYYTFLGGPREVPSINLNAIFSDSNRIGPASRLALQWGYANNLITGSGGRLFPADSASRSAIVLILFRFNNMFTELLKGSPEVLTSEPFDIILPDTTFENIDTGNENNQENKNDEFTDNDGQTYIPDDYNKESEANNTNTDDLNIEINSNESNNDSQSGYDDIDLETNSSSDIGQND